jgi:adenine-specific DNA-methyltransferase
MPTLTWVGKEKVIHHHRDVPYRVLKKQYHFSQPDSQESEVQSKFYGNRIIHGDNLEALKSLMPEFEGQVNCIYIDPPYNTGNDIDKKTGWKYNDAVNDPKIRAWLGKTVGKEDLTKHDKWLCMMYPRLKLLHRLLKRDGVIFVSIDDNEMHNLRQIMDEIFGEQNFIAQLIWDKTRKNDAKLFSAGHEYILAYAKSLHLLREKKTVWREEKPGAREIIQEWRRLTKIHGDSYREIEVALAKWYKELPQKHPAKKLSRYKHVDKYGPWRDRDISWPGGDGPRYDVIHDKTGLPCAVPERGWIYATLEQMRKQIDLGLVEFRDDHTEPPIRKAHLLPVPEELDEALNDAEGDDEDDENVGLQVMPTYIYKQAQSSVRLLRQIFGGKKIFANPKDHEVLARLIRYVAPIDAVILDSFAGSGSTAHAVLEANKLDSGTRKFILIETMDYAETITAERVRRVVSGYGEGDKAVAGLGGSFDYYTIGERLLHEDGMLNPAVGLSAIRDYVAWTEGIPIGQCAPLIPMATEGNASSPYWLGEAHGLGLFFVWNDASATTLDLSLLTQLVKRQGRYLIYADQCALGEDFMRRHNIVYKKIPRDITRL